MQQNPNYRPYNFSGLLTTSQKMMSFIARLEKVARTDSAVLIRGQSGTGKDLVARHLHALGKRANKPFNAINCAALTPELMASELFGHKRGAFTGAVNDHAGLFSVTRGGTLFLDEVAELTPDIQARLLRVVQEKTFTPVGSTEVVRTDVRFVAATHTSLRRRVAEGKFREDLMYRLRVIPLYLPPLIERDDDVAMLVWQFIERFNALGVRMVTKIDQRAWEALLDYAWPGNVRELQNAIEYAHVIGSGEVLRYDDLLPELRGEAPPDELAEQQPQDERSKMLALLRQFRGNRTAMAKHLNISRSTLWRQLKTLGLEGDYRD